MVGAYLCTRHVVAVISAEHEDGGNRPRRQDALGTLTCVTLPTRQYVSFSISSSVMPASEMARVIGLAADKVTVRGSRWRGDDQRPPAPRARSRAQP